MTKNELRKKYLTLRRCVEGRQEKSKEIYNRLCKVEEYLRSKKVMYYVSFNSEVDTQYMINEELRKREKRIYVPKVEGDNLLIFELSDFDELRPGFRNILEPIGENRLPEDPKKMDVVIVPGVVFDLRGNRIGYGGGYYDRFLRGTYAVKIGLAFDIQIIDNLSPVISLQDEKVDILISEAGVYFCKVFLERSG
jgi:5-formyltetrahydrofolate cyclo-ligase